MKGKSGAAAEHLMPVLDTYMGAAVALVGCTSRGLARYSCEYDVLVVGKERPAPMSLNLGSEYADLIFLTEKDVLKPATPERSLSIAQATPVRDNSLIISTGSAACSATYSEMAKAASRTRLASSLKSLVRAGEAVAKDALVDADFWLLAASYEYAYALLLSREVIPSPSHLLYQLRTAARGHPRGFERVSMGAGLEAASRAGCGARLDGLSVLHDLLREGEGSGSTDSNWSEVRTEILGAKARELTTRSELAECYSFLGQELVDDLIAIQKRHPKRSIDSLTTGGDKLLGERLVRQLGLTRDEKSVKTGLDVVRRQVSLLAKRL